MTKREALELTAQENRLMALGFSRDEAETMHRISMTLRRWYEKECGDGNGCIERDDETQKPFWLNSYTGRRFPIADRERGALRRLQAIMERHAHLTHYIQTDPRGCSLYILTPEQLDSQYDIHSIYTRGVAVA